MKEFPDWMTSETYKSNVFTMNAVAEVKPHLAIPETPYTMPSKEVRELRARLILEECLEKIGHLGLNVLNCGYVLHDHSIEFVESSGPGTVEQIIDDCNDIIYVATGTLVAMGVPDVPHQREVDKANNAKFPNGKVVGLREDGKYKKPEGWKEPDHEEVKFRVLNPGRMTSHKCEQCGAFLVTDGDGFICSGCGSIHSCEYP